MVDLIPGDMREQGFPILRLFHIPGQLIVFGLGYWLLKKHLSQYTIFWIISLSTDWICVLFFVTFIPESMPDKMKRPLTRWDFFPGTYYYYAIRIVCKYPLLIGICPCIAMDSFAFRGMGSVAGNLLWSASAQPPALSCLPLLAPLATWIGCCCALKLSQRWLLWTRLLTHCCAVGHRMGPLKFKQEENLIPHLIGMLCGIPANIIGATVIPRTDHDPVDSSHRR